MRKEIEIYAVQAREERQNKRRYNKGNEVDCMFDYESYDAMSDDGIAEALYRAMKIKPADIDFDTGKKDAYIRIGRSSSWYHATLSSCNCETFFLTNGRKSPCEHMFRLAHELGYEFYFPELDPGADYDPASDLQLLHQRWADGEITYDAYRACKTALEKSVRAAEKARRAAKKS